MVLADDSRQVALRWRSPSAGWRTVIKCLAGAGADIGTLATVLAEHDGALDWTVLHYRVQTLASKVFLNLWKRL